MVLDEFENPEDLAEVLLWILSTDDIAADAPSANEAVVLASGSEAETPSTIVTPSPMPKRALVFSSDASQSESTPSNDKNAATPAAVKNLFDIVDEVEDAHAKPPADFAPGLRRLASTEQKPPCH